MLAIQKGNHNFGTTSLCRVPLRKRAPHQRITPDVQTGCISCASGDGRFGGPIWWNTPLEDETAEAEDNRAIWSQNKPKTSTEKDPEDHQDKKPRVETKDDQEEEEQEEEEEEVEAPGPVPQPDGDDIPQEVRDRLAALKKQLGHHAD